MADPEIKIKISADDSDLRSGLASTEKSLKRLKTISGSVGSGLTRFGDQAKSLGNKMTVAAAGVAGLSAGAYALVKDSAAAGDEIAKTARAVGVSTGYFQEMAYAIGQVSDLSRDELSGALQRLTRTIGEGADGSKLASDALEKLGFTQSQIASGSITTQQAMDSYIATMSGIQDPALAAAISSDLLGRSGMRLGAQLSGAAGDIASLRDRANELGIVLSKPALDAGEKFGDQMDDLTKSFEGVRMKIGAELLPLFTEQLIPLIQERIIPALLVFGEKIGDIIQWFSDLPGPVQEAIGIIAAGFAVGGPLLIGIGFVSTALGGLVAASGPIGLFIAAAVLATAAWATWGDDIKAAVGGAIDYLSGKFQAVLGFMQSIIDKAGEVAASIANALSFGAQPSGPGGLTGFGEGGATAPGEGDTGYNLGVGMVEGLGASIADNEAAIREHIAKIPAIARDELGVHSPSVVFSEIGGFIGEGLAQGIASSQQLVASAVKSVGGAAVTAADGTVSGILGSMSQLFKGSKAIALAQAAVNIGQGLSEALKLPFPANIAAFAKTAAMGAQALGSIKSASPGSSSSSSAASASAAAPVAPTSTASITLVGDTFTRSSVEDLFSQINQGLKQGRIINLVRT